MSSINTDNIKALILDMDGVVWRGPQPIGDLPAIFAEIDRRGWKVVLATNNATQTSEQYAEKLAGFGVTIEPRQVVTSGIATAAYLSEKYPEGGRVYLIGEGGLQSALSEKGFQKGEEDVLAVVVSMDRNLTFEKLRRGTLLVRRGASFYATNPDRTFPTPDGLIPGAGAILAAMEAATEQRATVIGKPQPEMYRVALSILQVSPENVLVVGDRPETDITGGQRLGCRTALVLSGVTSETVAHDWRPPPDLIASDLADLFAKI
jgi:4-nitrophenyl phosphatase